MKENNWKLEKKPKKKEIIIFMANLSLVYVIRDQILNRDLLVTSRGPSKVTSENRFNAATQYYGSSASSSLLWWSSSELHPPSSVQKLNLPHTWAYILSNMPGNWLRIGQRIIFLSMSKVTAENWFNAATQYFGSSASSLLLWLSTGTLLG